MNEENNIQQTTNKDALIGLSMLIGTGLISYIIGVKVGYSEGFGVGSHGGYIAGYRKGVVEIINKVR